jgi:hypothetical protein
MVTKSKDIRTSDLKGFKYFKNISKLLQTLHKAGCERDRAGNRILHMDQYICLLLLCMFSPVCTSLRAMQQASKLKKVQSKLRLPRAALGSLSEASRVFDSELLIGIIGDLVKELEPIPHCAKLDELKAVLTVVDGTLFKALPKTVEALWYNENNRAFKAHIHYEVLKGVPVSAKITNGNIDERRILSENLESGRLYVLDRGFCDYRLLQQIIDINSSFICRIKNDAHIEIQASNNLSDDDIASGITDDWIVKLGRGDNSKIFKDPVRIIKLKTVERTRWDIDKRNKRRTDETMLIATNRTDLSADTIALIYQHRWQVETFFRFFKHILGCRHLLSYCDNGVQLQVYVGIIACLLIALYTGRKPTKRTYEMFCWYLSGWADEQELLEHIEHLKNQD